MAYTTAEGRQQLLDELAGAVDEIALALAYLGEAYEHLDERSADTLEEQLFRPVQNAYGRAKRTHSEFAARAGLEPRTFEPGSPGPASTTTLDLVAQAAEAAGEAGELISELQDSMLPVEVGDAELRAGLAAVRELLDTVEPRARTFARGFGR